MEAVVDTNVYIHAVIQDSAKHREARSLIESFSKIHLPIIVIYEIVWAMRKLGLSGEKINEVLESITSDSRVRVVHDEAGKHSLQAMKYIVSEKIDVGNFNDKVILSTAQNLGLPLATYDKELKKEAIARGVQTISSII
jgi:predicted nucleic acid-binding protein